MLSSVLRNTVLLLLILILKVLLGCWYSLGLIWDGLVYLWRLKLTGTKKTYLQALKLTKVPNKLCFAFQYGENPSPDDLVALADWSLWVGVTSVVFYLHTLDTSRYTWRLASHAQRFTSLEVINHASYIVHLTSLALKGSLVTREALLAANPSCDLIVSIGSSSGMPLCGLGSTYTSLSELEYGGRHRLFSPLKLARVLQTFASSEQRVGR
jgi:hypothetical protein